jgi:hypothetical protein
MKRLMTLSLLWWLVAGNTLAEQVPQIANVLGRQTISLN